MERFDLTEEYQTIELLKERFIINKKLDTEFFKFDIRRIRDFSDYTTESMLYEMMKIIAYEKKTDILEVDFPANLWEFIKSYYLPSFFRKYFPVKTIKMRINAEVKVKYLDIPVALQDKNPKIQILSLEPNWTKYFKKVLKRVESDVETINISHPEVKTISFKDENYE
jgi:hypothetical protein